MMQPLWNIVGKFFYNTNYTITIWSSSCAPWYFTKWTEDLHLHKPACECYSSSIYNSSKIKATNVSFIRWTEKQIGVHPSNGILFSNKNKWAIKPHTHTWKKLKCTLVRERVNLEKARYCMILTTGHLEKGKTMQTV